MTSTPAEPGAPAVVREVGLRDGLQILSRTMPTAHKLQWLRAAHGAGLREIEVGSFVPPRLMPLMLTAIGLALALGLAKVPVALATVRLSPVNMPVKPTVDGVSHMPATRPWAAGTSEG